MTRFLISFFALLVTIPALAAEKPNVVLIVLDDYGWRDSCCYGSTYHRTPNIDRLAKEGIRFTEAYAACPVCSPTRAAIMTGKYPQRVGITDWLPGRPDSPDKPLLRPKLRMELPLEEITIAEALKAAGYVTGLIGKWHLGGKGFGPKEQGFDVNIGGDHTGTPLSYFAPYRNKKGTMPGLEEAPEGEYLTDRYGAEAVKFITANKDRPFFLYLPHNAVHTPLRAPADRIAKYQPGKPGTQGNPTYAAMVESVDAAIGKVLTALDDLKLADKTLVILTSDNGGLATLEGAGMGQPATINSPLREGKGWLYEGGIRVPLIIRGPVVKPGTTSNEAASSIDIFPTILDACGVKTISRLDGFSLLQSPMPSIDRGPFWHYPHYANQGSRPGGAMRSGNWKLIEFYETGRRELFNLAKDQSESQNIAGEHPELVKEMAVSLDAWRKSVGAKLPTPNPDYKPNPQAKDGSITLHARTATVHGSQLRYEPLPHKLTLGYWTRAEDHATWEFTLETPGSYAVEVLQGCGRGSGGSVVEIACGESRMTFPVKETGGFQNFEARQVGKLVFDKPGRHTLTVKPLNKPGAAVMDLRQITLKPTR